MKKLWYILILLVFLATACDKRYPEGPYLSFIKADNRIAGKWEIAEMAIDDSTFTVPAFRENTLSFFFNIDHLAFVNIVNNATDSIVAQGHVIINDRRTIMEFSLLRTAGNEGAADSILLRIPPMENKSEWLITKLRKKEMHLSTVSGNKEYKLSLKLASDYDNY